MGAMNPSRPPLPLSALLSRIGALALLSVAGAACSGSATNGPPAKAVAAPAPLLQQIEAEIGDAACDAAAQCRTVALGSKACGGPERYLAWSTARSDSARLAQLAEQYAAARQAENARSGMMSTCDVIIDPGATCQGRRCVPLPRGVSPGAGAPQT